MCSQVPIARRTTREGVPDSTTDSPSLVACFFEGLYDPEN
jgi:hypothetical protein